MFDSLEATTCPDALRRSVPLDECARRTEAGSERQPERRLETGGQPEEYGLTPGPAQKRQPNWKSVQRADGP